MEIVVEQEITITIGEFQQKITIEECRYLRDRLNEIMGQSTNKAISSRSPLDQSTLRKAYEEVMAESRAVQISVPQIAPPPPQPLPTWRAKEYVPIPEDGWTPPEKMKPEDIF